MHGTNILNRSITRQCIKYTCAHASMLVGICVSFSAIYRNIVQSHCALTVCVYPPGWMFVSPELQHDNTRTYTIWTQAHTITLAIQLLWFLKCYYIIAEEWCYNYTCQHYRLCLFAMPKLSLEQGVYIIIIKGSHSHVWTQTIRSQV